MEEELGLERVVQKVGELNVLWIVDAADEAGVHALQH